MVLPLVFYGGGDKLVFRRSGDHPYRKLKEGRMLYLSVHSMLFLLVTLLELLDSTGGVHQLLFAGIKRMAIRADIYGLAVYGGAGFVGSAAGTFKGSFFVFGVQLFFHQYHSLDPKKYSLKMNRNY
jgi:hypothetical protein